MAHLPCVESLTPQFLSALVCVSLANCSKSDAECVLLACLCSTQTSLVLIHIEFAACTSNKMRNPVLKKSLDELARLGCTFGANLT